MADPAGADHGAAEGGGLQDVTEVRMPPAAANLSSAGGELRGFAVQPDALALAHVCLRTAM